MSLAPSPPSLPCSLSSTLTGRLQAARNIVQQHWQTDTVWLDDFKKQLDNFDVLTIDVFDTAITRIVETPVDVFALMEASLTEQYGSVYTGFATLRETAERLARQTAWQNDKCHEITQHAIYTELARILPNAPCTPEQLAALELTWECHACIPTPELQQVVNIAHQAGRSVLFVSDMYLPASSIQQLLTQANYAPNSALLVSSETLHTKADGSQWQLVKNKYPAGTKFLHVGDNAHSDGTSPLAHGIAAYLYTKARSAPRTGGPLTPAIIPFSVASRVVHLTPTKQTSPNLAMAQLGATWGALVAGAYANWVAERATVIKARHVFFCARDGELPFAAWNAMGLGQKTHIPASYLYISRKALNFGAAALSCTPEHLSDAALETIAHTYKPNSVHTLLSNIGFTDNAPIMAAAAERFGTLSRLVLNDAFSSLAKFKTFLQEQAASVYPHLCQARDEAIAYLCQEGLHEGAVALIDVGWHGTMQASITQLLRHAGHKPQIYGFYCGLWSRAQQNRPIAGWLEGAFGNDFIPDTTQHALRNAVPILENLFAANHGTTLGYCQNQNTTMVPVLANTPLESAQHKSIITPFQEAALTTLRHITVTGQYQALYTTDLTINCAFAAIARLALSPTPSEISAIGALEHCGDVAHTDYLPLVSTTPPVNTADYVAEVSKSEWPIATALSLLAHCPAQEKGATAQALHHQFSHYDTRTQAQFQ